MEATQHESKTAGTTTPRIYVASLSDYVAGRLHGRWIDANHPAGAVWDEINAMLAESKEPNAEEWAIHDFEGFGGVRLGECENIEKVAELAFLIVEHGPVFAELAAYFGGTSGVDEARRYMEEAYRGEFDSLEDYVQEFVEECYSDVLKALPDFIRYNVDWDGIANDMDLNGEVITFRIDHKTHVFEANV
jgi:antirestriction protein